MTTTDKERSLDSQKSEDLIDKSVEDLSSRALLSRREARCPSRRATAAERTQTQAKHRPSRAVRPDIRRACERCCCSIRASLQAMPIGRSRPD
jgi:hypothetical protein